MPHLSRLLAAVCAITVILVSLPTDAGIGDKDLPLLNGKKTKLLYSVVGVTDAADSPRSFHCTSTERSGGKAIQLGSRSWAREAFRVTMSSADEGAVSVLPGYNGTFSTQDTLVFSDDRQHHQYG